MLKSLMAVLLPVVAWGVLWVGGNALGGQLMAGSVSADGIPQGTGLLLGFVVYSVLLSLFAGWMCARIAPARKTRHVTVLAIVQLLIGIAVQSGVWNQMPVWYHLLFLALVVPAHLIGGRLGSATKAGDPGQVAFS